MFRLSILLSILIVFLGIMPGSSLTDAQARPLPQTAQIAPQVITNCPTLTAANPSIYVHLINQDTVVKVPFDDYVITVVESEIFPHAGNDRDGISEWHLSTLYAQAVLARTYAFTRCGRSFAEYGDQRVPVITTEQQAYIPGKADYEAVLRPFVQRHLWLAHTDNLAQPVDALFKNYTHDRQTFYTKTANQNGPLKGVYDPVSNAPGHDDPTRVLPQEGLGQNSADHWARGNSHGTRYPAWDYTKILAHYYTNVQLRDDAGTVFWGPHRWNALHVNRERFRDGVVEPVTVLVQNTGTTTWPQGTKLSVYWQRCQGTNCTSTITTSRPEAVLPIASTGLAPGDHVASTLYLKSPAGFYTGWGAYSLHWDVRLPSGQYLATQGWQEQAWSITLLNQPSAPTPPPARCGRPPCPLNAATPSVSWGASQSVDPVNYVWEREAADGSVVRGRTAATNAMIPLREGVNIVRARAEDTTPEHNQSPTVELERLLYDATPPTLTLTTLPPWSNTTSITLRWSGSDPLSGVRDYTLEQQVNDGAWTTLLSPSPATEQTVSTPQEGAQYRFRVTAADQAGNTTTRLSTTTIDRTAPSSRMMGPSGTIDTTWTVLRWTGSDDRSGVARYMVEYQVGSGPWQLWRTVIGGNAVYFQGTPHTTYGFRIHAVDQAGNAEPVHPSADITVTTGMNTVGLHHIVLPLVSN